LLRNFTVQRWIRPVSHTTRIFMEQRFRISIADQLAIERYFDNLTVIKPIVLGSLERYLQPCHLSYDRRYVHEVNEFDMYRTTQQF
jgi:hypothetical protein